MRWFVGITTAPRKALFLDKTWASLQEAGFEEGLAVAEPSSPLPELAGLDYFVHGQKQGAWLNWRSLVDEALRRSGWDWCLLCQDDVIVRPGLRAYLDRTLPAGKDGIWSPYTSEYFRQFLAQAQRGKRGWLAIQPGGALLGALTLIFPRATLERLRPLLPEQVKGNMNIDFHLGKAAKEQGIWVYTHMPSLAQHLGDDTSTLGYKAHQRNRQAGDYQDAPIKAFVK